MIDISKSKNFRIYDSTVVKIRDSEILEFLNNTNFNIKIQLINELKETIVENENVEISAESVIRTTSIEVLKNKILRNQYILTIDFEDEDDELIFMMSYY